MIIENDDRAVLISALYRALAAGDSVTVMGLHADDVVYNVAGETCISGRWQGKDHLASNILPRTVAALDLTTVRLARNWRVVCADSSYVVGMMDVTGITLGGDVYRNMFLHIFAFRGKLISEVWEFLDTAMMENLLFGNRLSGPYQRPSDHQPFQLPFGRERE